MPARIHRKPAAPLRLELRGVDLVGTPSELVYTFALVVGPQCWSAVRLPPAAARELAARFDLDFPKLVADFALGARGGRR